MFPGGYLPDYGRPRAHKTAAKVSGSTSSAPATSTGAGRSSTSGVVSVSALPHAPVSEAENNACASTGRVDTRFALPPALITCLVRHIDSQHNILATPAIVERCLRDLQRRLMPWVPAERVFGSTMRATMPVGIASGSGQSGAAIPGGSLAALPTTSTPQAGSYLAGSHVRLQLAKTTDNSVVVAIGASVLHLLFYAVDEPESRPSHLAHIVQEWLEALKTKGEEHDCMVLLVHSDLVAASEAAARMAEEAQRVGGGNAGAPSASRSVNSTPPPPRAPVSQDKVDAASAQLRKYYKELQDLKLSHQQVCAYMPNETPMRILERLRPAVIARGGRLRQALQIAAARRRQFPQDPATKPVLAPAPSTQSSAAPAPSPSAAASPPPPPPSSPQVLRSTGSSPQRGATTTASPGASPPAARRTSSSGAPPASTPASPPPPHPAAQYFNVQALWRTGYDLVVHYLQYGLVFDAREALEHLYLEYYNNSDDYIFLRTPITTLERLGRVPNLFDAHGHGGWNIGRTGYPTALEPGSELLEGLLLLASAEMTCSLLLGDTSAALLRYNTFVQVTREKFEEWTTLEATAKRRAAAAPTVDSKDSAPPQQKSTGACAVRVAPSTYQQFFLLQCYLSGLRMWWPTSGLCRPRKVTSSRPTPPPAAATEEKQPSPLRENSREKEEAAAAAPSSLDTRSAASMFSPLSLPPLKLSEVHGIGDSAALPAPKTDDEDGSVAVALSHSPLLLPATATARNAAVGASFSAPAFTTTYVTTTTTTSSALPGLQGGDSAGNAPVATNNSQVFSDAVSGSGVRYSMTNPSFAAPGGTSISGLSFRGLGSFAGRSEMSNAERQGNGGFISSPLLIAASAPSNKLGSGKGDGGSSRVGQQRPPTGDDGDAEEEEEDGGEDAELANFELRYLVAGSEDSVQVSVEYLIELAVSTGLVAPSMEAEELRGTAEAIREATEDGNIGLMRELQLQHRQLRRRCAELASLLERARDCLAAVAHDLGYNPFCRFLDASSAGQEDTITPCTNDNDNNVKDSMGPTTTPNADTTAVTATAFSNVEELSSPVQALRLWRILAAMAALALHIGDQRRREFHLYARLAVTFLSDYPTVTATIVADRLLPYVKTLGWSTIEIFVRRLYVEARKQLMRRVGLFEDIVVNKAELAQRSNAPLTPKKTRRLHSKVWLRIFRTGPAYALYRECILMLISSGSDDNNEVSSHPSRSPSANTGDERATDAQTQQAPDSQGLVARKSLPAAPSGISYVVAGVVDEEDAVGALDARLFAVRTKTQWWRELLRVDALVMNAFYASEPPEFPMNSRASPLMVRLEKQRPSGATAGATEISATPSPAAGDNALIAEVDDVVQMSFSMTCAVNPLVGPDGGLHLRRSSTSAAQSKPEPSAVRLQLTLESRKDWMDEDEATHVVHVHDCDEASYDEATRQLRSVFLFAVCHAGVYRVRRIRLCNGTTWLAHYPQHDCAASGARGKKRNGVHALLSGGGALSLREAAVVAQSSTTLDASFQPVTHAPVLRVPEPRSSVHLKLILPNEAHCFADSVDYATLDVDLEDPLSIAVSCGGSAAGQPSSVSGNKSEKVTAEEASRTGKDEGSLEGEDIDAREAAATCSCFYEASPDNLLLPLSVAAAGAGGCHSRRMGSPIGEGVVDLGPQQRVSSVSPGYRALLGNDGAGAAESATSGSDLSRSRGPALIAALVLATPNVYRPKAITGSAGVAGASTRVNLGASFSHLAGPHSPDASAASVGAWMGLSGSFAHRGHPGHHHHHHHHLHHYHSANSNTSPADAHLSSSMRSTSHPLVSSSFAQGEPAGATLPRTSSGARYKGVFKSLRLGAAAEVAAPTEAVHRDATRSPESGNTSNIAATERPGSRATQRHRQHHHHSHHIHTLPRSPAVSEPGVYDGAGGEEGFVRRAAHSVSNAAHLVSLGASSPLREIDGETFELILKHPVKAEKETDAKAATSTPLGLKPNAAVTHLAAKASVARTSIPIHLGTFLNSIPTPEVDTQAVTTFSTPASKQAAEMASTLGPLLQAVSQVSSSDHLRESIIHLLPSRSVQQATAAGAEGDATVTARVPITRMRLRVPLLPLLVTPASTEQLHVIEAEKAMDGSSNSNNGNGVATTSSSAETAKQARIMFTCMRGREPSTTSLNVVIPFQLAISFDYAFKHFQGRVYCLVCMKNLLRTTSLWLRGAVLRVLDPEPSYEIVRVCDVYNQLLMTEWKPQEELSILYELDLIASFHPVQPECAHQVQMQVFYSSWEKSFMTTPAEDRLVLRTVQLPPTEATAESVELIHGDGTLSSPLRATAAAKRVGGSVSEDDGDVDDYLSQLKDEPLSQRAPPPNSPAVRHDTSPTVSSMHTAVAALSGRVVSNTATSGLSSHSDGSLTRSATQVAHSNDTSCPISKKNSRESEGANSDDDAERRTNSSAGGSNSNSSVAASGAVHFNIVTLRHLEETCNAVCGPVATFHSKHLCVFSIVMYAESPWTMRFGAATNYLAKAPTSPLSGTASLAGTGGGPLPRSSVQPSRTALHHHLSNSTFASSQSGMASLSGSAPNMASATGDSFFGNAMVDQPSDFVFVAGEPVRFCVRLQPLAQNWPEDANMEETFFIRLKYNPAEWMVVGKQRDRRTLSLMEEVTVYFNAVPLLPLASAGAGDDPGKASRSPIANTAEGLMGYNVVDEEDEEGVDGLMLESEGEGGARKTARSSRPLAGHAVRDEGILQTPTVEMFWERKKPAASAAVDGLGGSFAATRHGGCEPPSPSALLPTTHVDAAMGEPVLIDVVQFRTWVRVRKHGH